MLLANNSRFFTAQVLFAILQVFFRTFCTEKAILNFRYWFCYAFFLAYLSYDITMSGGRRGATSWQLCNFYLYLRLKSVFPALKLSKNYYINMNFVPPSSLPITYTVPERQSSKPDKIWKRGNFRNLNFSTL